VQHEETVFAQRDKLGHGQRRSPASLVDVPAHDMRGRNFAKPVDHLRFADVAGVDNHVRPAERVEGLRPQQPVGIRDDTQNEFARTHLTHLLALDRADRLRSRRVNGHRSQNAISRRRAHQFGHCRAQAGSCIRILKGLRRV
jgi:hypothetical protein